MSSITILNFEDKQKLRFFHIVLYIPPYHSHLIFELDRKLWIKSSSQWLSTQNVVVVVLLIKIILIENFYSNSIERTTFERRNFFICKVDSRKLTWLPLWRDHLISHKKSNTHTRWVLWADSSIYHKKVYCWTNSVGQI